MRGAAKKRSLANNGLIPNGDRIHRITINFFGKAGEFTHRQVPGRPDLTGWQDIRSLADFGTKTSQQKPPPAIEHATRRGAEEKQPYNIPNHAKDFGDNGMSVLVILKFELHMNLFFPSR